MLIRRLKLTDTGSIQQIAEDAYEEHGADDTNKKMILEGAACETPGAGGLAQSSILLVNTHSPWIADWMPAPEDRRHAERWK